MKSAKIATALKAKDVMTSEVLTVQPDWPLEQLADFLVKNSISGAPVVADDGEIVGVVSLSDLARANTLSDEDLETSTHAYYLQTLDAYEGEDELPILPRGDGVQLKVSEIMTPVVIAVGEDDPVGSVAAIMIENRVHRLFVTRDRKIGGVVTALDMLKVIRDSSE